MEGLSMSIPPVALLLFFLISGIELRPCKLDSSPRGISDDPDSIPSNVPRRSFLSLVNCRSVCSSRLSSRYSASSSAICSGVRFSRLRRYCFRVISLSVNTRVSFPFRNRQWRSLSPYLYQTPAARLFWLCWIHPRSRAGVLQALYRYCSIYPSNP